MFDSLLTPALLIFISPTWPFQTYSTLEGYIWNELTRNTRPLLWIDCICVFVCFSVIMDHLVNNAAEGWHCTTFSHENSFSFCVSLCLSLSLPSFSSPQAILIKQFHLSPSTQSVSICTANIKSGRRETDSNVLEGPALYSVNYFLPSGFFFTTGLIEFSSSD